MNQLTLQLKLEALYNKNQQITRLTELFGESEEIKTQAKMKGIPIPFVLNALAQMVVHKQANLETMIGILFHHTENSQKTADLLWKCVEADLIDWDESSNKFVYVYNIDNETQLEMDRYMYPPPMVVKPVEVKNNRENGYYLTRGSLILKDNYHENDICLDHINRCNRIELSLNQGIARNVKNHWKGTDERKAHESLAQFRKRQAVFEKYNTIAMDYIELVEGFDNVIHMTHKYDKRGRTYCQGYHINYQGNPWSKAIVEFANKEVIHG